MRQAAFEQLWANTAHSLYKARQYDRRKQFARELCEFDEMLRMIGQMKRLPGGEYLADAAVEKLQMIQHRLMTIMEDLLYTAV